MPNWCSNTVKIQSNKEFSNVLKGLIDKDSIINLFFKKTLDIDNSSSSNWYHDNCRDIGCKWDIDAYVTFSKDDSIFITFDSPWSPPIAGLIELSESYKLNLEFDYDEPNICFIGKGSINANGDVDQDIWQGNEYLKGLYQLHEDINTIYDYIDCYGCIDSFLTEYADDLSDADFNDLKIAIQQEDNPTVIRLLNLEN
ncbi:hypothetical protein [Francisella sp. SYW-9]|uniref:DUF1281 family ferredoxin-like fold protein n=1 Tax=Francisella sp. SYW-9 TaxID=2610888 RepID=UPI00123D732F|nr:hypothetical protein [Francisella sp. SYW-9]